MKRIFKLTGFILFLIVTFAALTLFSNAEYENTHVNTGNAMEDIIAVAKTQLGYMEGSLEGTEQKYDDCTKYGEWYGLNYNAWCAMFVSWCADQADIPTAVIPKHANCDVGMQWFISKNSFEYSDAYGGSYTPKRGDIVYFGYKMNSGAFDSNHVGIVYKVENGKIYVYEGNSSAKVQSVSYPMTSNKYILGYGIPQYEGYVAPTYPTGYYLVNTAWLNFRSEPNTSAEKYELLARDTLLNITEISDNGWGKTEHNGKTGWLSLEYCKKIYLIQYQSEGASELPSAQYKEPGVDIKISESIPVMEDNGFLGWALAPNTEVVYLPGDSYTEDKDILLYAVWESDPILNTYTVSYDANEGTGAPNAQIKVENTDLTLSSVIPTREGYTFLGWSLERSGTIAYAPGAVYKADNDITLYAQWKEIPVSEKYIVTYDANGGTNAPAAQIKEENKALIISTQLPVYQGYEFIGWSLAAMDGAVYQPGDTYTENKSITLYAQWKPVAILGEFTLSYDANGGTGAPEAQIKTETQDITISDKLPVRQGYSFEGWAYSKDAKWADIFPGDSYTKERSVTLYALWAKELETIIIDCGTGGKVLRHIENSKLYLRIIADKGNALSRVTVNGTSMPLIGDTEVTEITLDYSFTQMVEIRFTNNSKLWINPYDDVKDTAWYYDSAHFCYTKGIMKGTSPTTFAPDKALTRAEFVTILGRIYENGGGVISCNGSLPFTDVKDTSYYYLYLCWAYNNGIVAGISETAFSPGSVLTREQMCLMLYNYTDFCGKISTDYNKTVIYAYKDNEDISSWAKDSVAWAISERYISGYKSKLTPKETATRAQAATVITKYFK